MRTSTGLTIAVILLGFTTVGCGSMRVTRTMGDATVDGLRVQVPVPHDVFAVFRDKDGKTRVQKSTAPLPEEGVYYDLNFTGALFATRSLNVDIANGILKSYAFASKASVDKGLTSTSEAIETVTDALKEAGAPGEEPNDPLDDANDQLRREVLNMMLEANRAALERGDPIPYPDVI